MSDLSERLREVLGGLCQVAREAVRAIERLHGLIDEHIHMVYCDDRDIDPADYGALLTDIRKQVDGLREDYATSGLEVDRLRAIVDKVPKCNRLNEQGELVQDVPVVPGMNVWVLDRITKADRCYQCTVTDVNMSGIVRCSFHGVSDGPFDSSELYTERRAAQAALDATD
jgi:hypothetical protein